MNVCGIITEYNPLHEGHLIHLNKIENALKVCVMSGNFVQRGEPAITDKWSRARAAVESGVDLVLELPTYYCLSSAEGFAFGAVATLNALGIVDTLCFGSECGDITKLTHAATVLLDEPPEFKAALKEGLSRGLSFAEARSRALPFGDILTKPNNILGVEYIKALLRLNSKIIPTSIKREKAECSSLVTSATICRKIIKSGGNASAILPASSFENLKNPVFFEDFEQLLLYSLKMSTLADITSIMDTGDSLANRIFNAREFSDIKSCLTNIKTKRYPLSRVKRILFNILLKNNINYGKSPEYIRILAMNENGARILKLAKKTATLPIITKCANIKPSELLELDFRATDVYSIIQGCERDLKKSPIIVS